MRIIDPELLASGESTRLRQLAPCGRIPANQNGQQTEPLKYAVMNVCDIHSMQDVDWADRSDAQWVNYLNGSLQSLTQLHRIHPSMQALLQTASRLVVDIMGLEHCSIGWLNDNEFGIEIWTSHTRDGAEVNHSRVHKAFSGMINRKRAKPVEKPVDPRHRLDASQAVMGKREIVSPLRVDKQIVGYVCGLKSEFSEETILATEKSLFSALSEHISAAIEAQRTREMLDSPYVALALTPVERECLAGLTPTERPFLSPVNDPERLVRKIARRFFADLYRAGFEIKHILYLATEILDSLLVAQHEAKSE